MIVVIMLTSGGKLAFYTDNPEYNFTLGVANSWESYGYRYKDVDGARVGSGILLIWYSSTHLWLQTDSCKVIRFRITSEYGHE